MGQEPSGPALANCQRSGWFDSLSNKPKTFVPQGSLKSILILKLVTEFLMEKKDLLGKINTNWTNYSKMSLFSCGILKKTNLLLIEDAGLLEGVLALGYVPYSDRPVIATGSQKAFLTAPTTCDDLKQQEDYFNHQTEMVQTTSLYNTEKDQTTDPALVSL